MNAVAAGSPADCGPKNRKVICFVIVEIADVLYNKVRGVLFHAQSTLAKRRREFTQSTAASELWRVQRQGVTGSCFNGRGGNGS